MNFKIKVFKNINIYKNLKSYQKGDEIILENFENWREFFSQNITFQDRKRNPSFIWKKILRNINGFSLVIDTIGFNKKQESGYFLDYSTFINIFLFFKTENDVLNYVQDNCQARGDKVVQHFDEAITYLTNEGVVISKIISIEIDKTKWIQFKSEIETLKNRPKN